MHTLKKKKQKKEKAVQEESIHLANGWIPGKKKKKGKKGKIQTQTCTAACRQGDPLACCLLLACQRKFCPCLGSSTLKSCSALCCGSWWAPAPGGGGWGCPACESTRAWAACQAVPGAPGTTSASVSTAPLPLLLPPWPGQVILRTEFITSWVLNPLWCHLQSYWVLLLTSAASWFLQLYGKLRINRTT